MAPPQSRMALFDRLKAVACDQNETLANLTNLLKSPDFARHFTVDNIMRLHGQRQMTDADLGRELLALATLCLDTVTDWLDKDKIGDIKVIAVVIATMEAVVRHCQPNCELIDRMFSIISSLALDKLVVKCDAQMLYICRLLVTTVHCLTDICMTDSNMAENHIGELTKLIMTMEELGGFELTSVHSDLCRLILASRSRSDMLQNKALCKLYHITETGWKPSHGWQSHPFSVDLTGLLSTCYYSGMITSIVERYESAAVLFEICLAVQGASEFASAMSRISVEAFKKAILCRLMLGHDLSRLENGGDLASDAASQISARNSRFLAQICPKYIELASVFTAGRPADLRNFLDLNRLEFEADHNWAFVSDRVAKRAHIVASIFRVAQAFRSLPLDHLSRLVMNGLDSQDPVSDEDRSVVLQLLNATQSDSKIKADVRPNENLIKFYNYTDNVELTMEDG